MYAGVNDSGGHLLHAGVNDSSGHLLQVSMTAAVICCRCQ
jgi:hypothetical protein